MKLQSARQVMWLIGFLPTLCCGLMIPNSVAAHSYEDDDTYAISPAEYFGVGFTWFYYGTPSEIRHENYSFDIEDEYRWEINISLVDNSFGYGHDRPINTWINGYFGYESQTSESPSLEVDHDAFFGGVEIGARFGFLPQTDNYIFQPAIILYGRYGFGINDLELTGTEPVTNDTLNILETDEFHEVAAGADINLRLFNRGELFAGIGARYWTTDGTSETSYRTRGHSVFIRFGAHLRW